MTETTSGARAGARRKGKGAGVQRIFTTPGVHPYDEVTWERRDVVQQNWKTGETIFEQRGVEFPDFWSVNASTIVTTKYFRGAVGTEQREQGLRQAHRPRRPHLRQGRPRPRLLRDPRGRRACSSTSSPGRCCTRCSLQLAGVVQRRHVLAAAGQRLLHPRRRRLDGLDPELVPRGGPDLQGRLRCRPQPLAHPVQQGACCALPAARRPAR
nr:hypothetical protein [Angustibacter aerolatus]